MSAITETEPGGEMVCIMGFSARPRVAGNQPTPGAPRKFHVGERVRYITSFYKRTPEDNPTGYMAVFEPIEWDQKTQYAATQNYFVSIDCWEGLKAHILSDAAARFHGTSVTAEPKKQRRTAKISDKAVPKK